MSLTRLSGNTSASSRILFTNLELRELAYPPHLPSTASPATSPSLPQSRRRQRASLRAGRGRHHLSSCGCSLFSTLFAGPAPTAVHHGEHPVFTVHVLTDAVSAVGNYSSHSGRLCWLGQTADLDGERVASHSPRGVPSPKRIHRSPHAQHIRNHPSDSELSSCRVQERYADPPTSHARCIRCFGQYAEQQQRRLVHSILIALQMYHM